MTIVYMRNPHLTPKARGSNFNRPKRLKQEDRKWSGVLNKNWRTVALVSIKKKIEAHGWGRPSSVELFAPPRVGPDHMGVPNMALIFKGASMVLQNDIQQNRLHKQKLFHNIT